MNTSRTNEYALDAQVTVASIEKGIHLMRQLERDLTLERELREAIAKIKE